MDLFDDAQNRLYRYFSNGCWELYDGVDVAQDAILTVCDIVLSVALNSRVDTRNKIWRIWQGKNYIEENLAKIPVNIFLESAIIPWGDLSCLFESFCRIKFVGEAVTTKILH